MGVDISTDSVKIILHEKLGLAKVCACWVRKIWSVIPCTDRVDIGGAILDLFNSDPEDFCLCVVI